MDEKMLIKGPAAEHELPLVSVGKKQERSIPAVQYASAWALASAVIVGFSFGFGYLVGTAVPAALLDLLGSWTGAEMTDAQVARASALRSGILWCTAPQAAAAALALLLAPHRRRARRALACAALAAAAVDHWMFAGYVGVAVAALPLGHPCWFYFMVLGYGEVLFFAVGDLIAMALLFNF